MKYVLIALLFFTSTQLFSQCDGRYESEIFDEVSKTVVEYTDVYDWSALDSGLDMDIYQPVGDTAINRPVLIFAHGGVYVTGNKDNPPMISLCEAFAKRGYVTASIQYRLTSSLSLLSPNASDIFSQTVLNSVSDMKAAVRYFRKDVAENNNAYGINPNFIFVGGYSAGAVTAAHLSVIDDNQVPAEFQSFYDEAGGIEGNSGNSGYSSEVSGAILLAGAINTLDFIDADDEPTVSLHASDDNTVSYECANALGNASLPYLCGSGKIHEELENVGVINDLYTFPSGGHAAPILDIEGTTVPFISDFLYNLICQSTSVDDTESPLFSVYPNPCQNYLNIENLNRVNSVVVVDMLGNIVLESQINSGMNQINTHALSQGVYFIYSTEEISEKQLFVKN
ncbi:MAG: carboxylesterase family protein [Flavobacteriales bacterium]|nr:carboxylesterase family protein [Flavobacteriales bacterium]